MHRLFLLTLPIGHQLSIESFEVVVLEVGIASLGNMPHELLKEFQVLHSDFDIFVGAYLDEECVILSVAGAAADVFLK